MEKITKPNVSTIATGKKLVAKQMQAKGGSLLPKHLADVESILFIHKGECVLNMQGEAIILKEGDGHIIPANIKHQIKVVTDFKGLHIMPVDIKFEFFD